MKGQVKSNDHLITEITDLRQRLAKLEALQVSYAETLEKFNRMFLISIDMLGTADFHGYFKELNPAWERALGWTIDELLAKPFIEFVHSEDREATNAEAARLATGTTTIHFRNRYLCKDGTYKWLSWNATAVLDEARIYFVARDITKLIQKEIALQESEQKFRLLAENIHEVFWMTTPGITEMLYVSPAYERIWQQSRDSLYCVPQSFIQVVHPDDQAKVIAALRDHAQGKWDIEYRIIQPSGQIRYIEDRGFPVYDDDGTLVRMVGLAADITRRKLIETDLRQALEREQELNHLKTHFTAMFSHELRNPLMAISMSAEQLERYREQMTDEQRRNNLTRIQAQVSQIVALMDNVLAMGKLDIAQLQVDPSPVHLEEFCGRIAEEIQAMTETHRIEFSTRGPSSQVLLDTDLFHSAITNLLSNAIKYSPAGKVVYFALIHQAGWATLQVRDQGIGIPEEDQPYLFETFHRARNVGDIQGSGLGLAIVKQIVEAHAGTITFTSEIGDGTTFAIKLPVSEPVPVSQQLAL